MATPEIINIGALPNDGSGDPLRVAFQKINNNFANLFYTATTVTNFATSNNAPNQVIFEAPVSEFTQGMFQIKSWDPGSIDSIDIILSAQITNNQQGVKFTAYGTTFNGNAVATYDMDVSGSNVRILCSPLISNPLQHFISSQITYTGPNVPGLLVQLDGYVEGNVMSTENLIDISTESA